MGNELVGQVNDGKANSCNLTSPGGPHRAWPPPRRTRRAAPPWSAWTHSWTRSSASWTARLSDDEYLPVERLSDLGARIAAAAGLGTNMELVVERVKLGGNGPIMANALAALGMDDHLHRSARRGKHPSRIRRDRGAGKARQPGRAGAHGRAGVRGRQADAGETGAPARRHLGAAAWSAWGRRNWSGSSAESDLVALINWTMIPGDERIWEQALAILANARRGGPVLFRPGRPGEARRRGAWPAAAACWRDFNPSARRSLGLNEKEALRVADALGLQGRRVWPGQRPGRGGVHQPRAAGGDGRGPPARLRGRGVAGRS